MYRAPTKENSERSRGQPQKTRVGHVAAGFEFSEFSGQSLVHVGAGVCGNGEAHQLNRVTLQRARPQASRKISMAAASAAKAGQLRAMFGARAKTARVKKIAVAAKTRSQSSQVLPDGTAGWPLMLVASLPERPACT